MVQRCTNPKRNNWHLYGGRGITVCSAWRKFHGFLADMESTYRKGLTLDRIDSNQGYYPENCRWATPSQQARNTRVQSRSRTGHKGVVIRDGKFRSLIRVSGRLIHLGTFECLHDAVQARRAAEERHHVTY